MRSNFGRGFHNKLFFVVPMLVVFSFFFMASYDVQGKKVEASEHLALGVVAPNFIARTLNSKVCNIRQYILEDYVGQEASTPQKLLVISFFATYCKPCIRELPFLNALYEKYKQAGLQVVSISVDKNKVDQQKVSALIKEKGVKFPVVKDPYNLIMKRYAVKRLPAVYMVNSEGEVSFVNIGYNKNAGKKLLITLQEKLGLPKDEQAVHMPEFQEDEKISVEIKGDKTKVLKKSKDSKAKNSKKAKPSNTSPKK